MPACSGNAHYPQWLPLVAAKRASCGTRLPAHFFDSLARVVSWQSALPPLNPAASWQSALPPLSLVVRGKVHLFDWFVPAGLRVVAKRTSSRRSPTRSTGVVGAPGAIRARSPPCATFATRASARIARARSTSISPTGAACRQVRAGLELVSRLRRVRVVCD